MAGRQQRAEVRAEFAERRRYGLLARQRTKLARLARAEQEDTLPKIRNRDRLIVDDEPPGRAPGCAVAGCGHQPPRGEKLCTPHQRAGYRVVPAVAFSASQAPTVPITPTGPVPSAHGPQSGREPRPGVRGQRSPEASARRRR